jgi:hypothetical protein
LARKVFQDFAHVLCQRFIEVPSNRDLVNLAILGGGTLSLDILDRRASLNRYPIEPLPYCGDARDWLFSQIETRNIPLGELSGASLAVKYTVNLSWASGVPYAKARFDFECVGAISSPDRQYTSALRAQKNWGLSTV